MHNLEFELDQLLIQVNTAMANEAKLKKLLFARNRLLSDVKHAITAAKGLNNESKRLLVIEIAH